MPLGLVSASSISNIGKNHQVVAYGYKSDPSSGNLDVYIYDNNFPDQEAILSISLSDPHVRESVSGNVVDTWRGFFVEEYDIGSPFQIPTPTPTPTPTPAPTPAPKCDPHSPTLRIGKNGGVGSTGSKVTELQRDLTELGYGELLGPPGIDGKFGPYTEGAVKQFQIDNGLKGKDGVAGPETWGAICDLLSSM
jgi:hypothetical protein